MSKVQTEASVLSKKRGAYSSSNVPEFYVRPAVKSDDAQLVALIAETMPSNGMILSSERYPSYLKAANTLYNRADLRVVVPKSEPNRVVGMMNLGWKYCYVNSEPDVLRYVGDLRLKPEYRGKKVLRVLMDYLHDELPKDTLLQSIILEDNLAARSVLHEIHSGFPQPFNYDNIQTFAVSKVKKPPHYKRLRFEPLSLEKVAEANAFVQSMSAYYNFLPNYDFSTLSSGHHPFWQGLTLRDFNLAYQDGQIVGLYGLWNQKSFKQMRVVHYSLLLKLMKPFYNAYAGLRGSLRLPQINEAFDYMMMHSPLCRPDDAETFSSLLFHAKGQLHRYRKSVFCLTLAENDPRLEQMKNTESHIMRAIHSFHSFQGNPHQKFDRSKISYFESGRI